jgi:hypothetical protein
VNLPLSKNDKLQMEAVMERTQLPQLEPNGPDTSARASLPPMRFILAASLVAVALPFTIAWIILIGYLAYSFLY